MGTTPMGNTTARISGVRKVLQIGIQRIYKPIYKHEYLYHKQTLFHTEEVYKPCLPKYIKKIYNLQTLPIFVVHLLDFSVHLSLDLCLKSS